MKVYTAYVKLNDDEYHNSNMYFDNSLTRFNTEYNIWTILYAHTNKKKLFKKFLLIHSDIFIIKTFDMDEEEYHKFTVKYKLSRIILYGFHYNDNEKDLIELPVTNVEVNCLLDDNNGSAVYYSDFASLARIDPSIFNGKIQKYLGNIYYTEDFITVYGSNDDIDYMEYNRSYGVYNSICGRRSFNEVALLCLTYSKFINVKGIHQYVIEVMGNEKS